MSWDWFLFVIICFSLSLLFDSKAYILQVRLCREKKSGNIYAMKKLKKSEMLSRGQVRSDIIKHYVLTYFKGIKFNLLMLSRFRHYVLLGFS